MFFHLRRFDAIGHLCGISTQMPDRIKTPQVKKHKQIQMEMQFAPLDGSGKKRVQNGSDSWGIMNGEKRATNKQMPLVPPKGEDGFCWPRRAPPDSPRATGGEPGGARSRGEIIEQLSKIIEHLSKIY